MDSTLHWNNSSSYVQVLKQHDAQIIISPFIQLNALKIIIEDNSQPDLKIITRWNPQDIITGVSDIEIYPYLRELRIPLYIHPIIHLKLLITNATAFHMSSNISSKGFGHGQDNNIEVGCFVDLCHQDWVNIYGILNNSVCVNDAIYEKVRQYRETNHEPPRSLPKLEMKNEEKGFSILDLPAATSPEELEKYYFAENKNSFLNRNACIHDLLKYAIPTGLDETGFYSTLNEAFRAQPFIQAFTGFLIEKNSVHFGGVKEWLQGNCSDQPTPYRWELTENTKNLYRWLTYFFDEIDWHIPGQHSQVIRWNES